MKRLQSQIDFIGVPDAVQVAVTDMNLELRCGGRDRCRCRCRIRNR